MMEKNIIAEKLLKQLRKLPNDAKKPMIEMFKEKNINLPNLDEAVKYFKEQIEYKEE